MDARICEVRLAGRMVVLKKKKKKKEKEEKGEALGRMIKSLVLNLEI